MMEKIFYMHGFERNEYWIAAKKGMGIAAKTALASGVIISLFYPLISTDKTELAKPVVMLVSFLYILFGFVVFSWLILGFGALGGLGLLFLRSLFFRKTV